MPGRPGMRSWSRHSSPDGRSTLTTSAPRSPRCIAVRGPARLCDRSRTRRPVRGGAPIGPMLSSSGSAVHVRSLAMGLMGRFTTIVKAKASKALDKAEDPRETLDYSYEKQLELLQNVRRGVADVATSKKRLELQAAKLEKSVEKLDTQARQALS